MGTNPFVADNVERIVLGMVIRDAPKMEKHLLSLEGGDFVAPEHRRTLEAMQQMNADQKPIDLVTLCSEHPELGDAFLAELATNSWETPAKADAYVKLLKEATQRRRAYTACRTAMDGMAQNEPVDDVIDRLMQGIRLTSISEGEETTSLRKLLIGAVDRLTTCRTDGFRLNIPGLDALLRGIYPTRLYVVGARPSVGKTVFGMWVAIQAALGGRKVLWINREMDKDDLLRRMITHFTGIPTETMENGKMTPEQDERYVETFGAMGKLDIDIVNNAKTVDDIRAEALWRSEKKPVGAIVIDYLQRLHPPARKFSSRDETVGYMTWALKDIAMDLKVPVILLSQLNRSAANDRPHMGTLRESGNIEQDADVVILLHMPDEDKVPAGRAEDYRRCVSGGYKYLELIVDKNRHGPAGVAVVGFTGERMRYVTI